MGAGCKGMAQDEDMTAIMNCAHLDICGFYSVLQKAGCGDLLQHPFASTVFKVFAGGNSTIDMGNVLAARIIFSANAEFSPAEGYNKEQWRGLVKVSNQSEQLMGLYQAVKTRMASLEGAASAVPLETLLGEGAFASWRKQCARVEKTHALQMVAGTGKIWDRYQEHMDPDELFARWDVSDEGHISHTNAVMFFTVVYLFKAIFAEFADEGSLTMSLNSLQMAMRALKFGDLPKMLPSKGLFSRFKDQHGQLEDIDVWEFVAGCARMARPVSVRADAMSLPGWPGLPCLNGEDSPSMMTDLTAYLDTLQTGDILVLSLMDDTARYFNFLTNCLWTHVGIVLKHKRGNRPGVPNLETEDLLKRHPFRWKTQHFCTPSYCKCFAADTPDQPVVELMEATGQGVHVYDMGIRTFTGFNAARIGTLAVRRLRNAPGRDNEEEVENFIRMARGRLYSVTNDDGLDSQFCSQLSTAFLRHMGWLSPDAKPDFEYHPDHYAKATVPLGGGAEWGELEVLRNQWTSRPLPLEVNMGKDAAMFTAVNCQ